MTTLTLGYSPCPNDTHIFYALVHGLVRDESFSFTERLEDVETLNGLAFAGALDVTKISFHLLGHIRDRYLLLRSGGALGRGCGPLVVSKSLRSIEELRGKRIAVPGRYTTAALLLRLFDPQLDNIVVLPFHEIMGAAARGEVDAGVIIHESRFTYPDFGLNKVIDLGEWWEGETGEPIPLGGIVARRDLGGETTLRLSRLIRESVEFADAHPERAADYIRAHSQEMSEEVCRAHIALYVNHFSCELGSEGERAVRTLLGMAEERGVIPRSERDLFNP